MGVVLGVRAAEDENAANVIAMIEDFSPDLFHQEPCQSTYSQTRPKKLNLAREVSFSRSAGARRDTIATTDMGGRYLKTKMFFSLPRTPEQALEHPFFQTVEFLKPGGGLLGRRVVMDGGGLLGRRVVMDGGGLLGRRDVELKCCVSGNESDYGGDYMSYSCIFSPVS